MKGRKLAATLLAVVAIAAPVVIYLWIFGVKISSDHARWAEFGSAMGGIYSPVIAVLALAVLLRQVSLQSQMNVHEFNQAYLQQARNDIEFYSTQLAQVLNSKVLPQKTLRAHLHEHFGRLLDAEDLDSPQLRELAANTHQLVPAVFDIWVAVYPILSGLKTGKAPMYEMTLMSSTQKLIALLSFETCAALDNFERVRTEGRIQPKYIFSPLLADEHSNV